MTLLQALTDLVHDAFRNDIPEDILRSKVEHLMSTHPEAVAKREMSKCRHCDGTGERYVHKDERIGTCSQCMGAGKY